MTAAGPWHLITGEYPPQPGGVADYSALVAAGLADAGAEVHVWAPAAAGEPPAAAGVAVHRPVVEGWSPADLRRLGAALDAFPAPRRLLVQYTPSSWGYKSLNLGFGRWLRRRRAAGDRLRAMVHEPFYPWQLIDRPTRWPLAPLHRLMARDLLAACDLVYVSIPGWARCLQPYAPRGAAPPMAWLPVPSNLPVADDPVAVAALRRRLAPGGGPIVGSFGTFGPLVGGLVADALAAILEGRPDRVGLALGRGGDRFAAVLAQRRPSLAGRLAAPGGLPPREASLHLQACDLLVQPYPDGVSSRRGSVMAGLAHGRPIVTNAGRLTEPIWSGRPAPVALASSGRPVDLAAAAEALIADPAGRAALGAAAAALYGRRFAVGRTVEALLRDGDRAG